MITSPYRPYGGVATGAFNDSSPTLAGIDKNIRSMLSEMFSLRGGYHNTYSYTLHVDHQDNRFFADVDIRHEYEKEYKPSPGFGLPPVTDYRHSRLKERFYDIDQSHGVVMMRDRIKQKFGFR